MQLSQTHSESSVEYRIGNICRKVIGGLVFVDNLISCRYMDMPLSYFCDILHNASLQNNVLFLISG